MDLDESFGEIDNDDLDDIFDYNNEKKKPESNQTSALNTKKDSSIIPEKKKNGSRWS